MKILQINEGERILHIRFEEGQAGKHNMMKKINKFLTSHLRAKRARLNREYSEILDSEDKDVIRSVYTTNLRVSIDNLDYKINKIDGIVTIDDYNKLHSVTIQEYTVE